MGKLIVFASTAVLLLFFYFRDENREPAARLMEAFILGAVISLQVDYLQRIILPFSACIFWQAFIVAGFVEESVKLVTLQLTLFRNRYFTEKIDGITYAVFLSLGFATAENILHVTSTEIGLVRAVTATPAHALFGVAMGYYVGRYKFNQDDEKLLVLALVIPAVLHGIYNALLMSGQVWGMVLFIPYLVFLWVKGLLRVESLNRKVKR